jgi:hypothetical protein
VTPAVATSYTTERSGRSAVAVQRRGRSTCLRSKHFEMSVAYQKGGSGARQAGGMATQHSLSAAMTKRQHALVILALGLGTLMECE